MSPTAKEHVRVLVVEDDESTSSVLGIYLPTLGLEVELAGNGRAALEAIPRFDPDVILLDLLMPEMDGWTFLSAYGGPVPIIVISAYSDMTDLPKKPFATVMKPGNMKEVAKLAKKAKASWR